MQSLPQYSPQTLTGSSPQADIEELSELNEDMQKLCVQGEEILGGGHDSILPEFSLVQAEMEDIMSQTKQLKRSILCTDTVTESKVLQARARGMIYEYKVRMKVSGLNLVRRPTNLVEWPMFCGTGLPLLPTFLEELESCANYTGIPRFERGKLLFEHCSGRAKDLLSLTDIDRNPDYDTLKKILVTSFGNPEFQMELIMKTQDGVRQIQASDNHMECYRVAQKHLKILKNVSLGGYDLPSKYINILEKKLPMADRKTLFQTGFSHLSKNEKIKKITEKFIEISKFNFVSIIRENRMINPKIIFNPMVPPPTHSKISI